MKFEITILGSGAATPTLKRFPTSQFVNCNERYILIDCGEGAQIQLRKYRLKFQKIGVILISHLHGDHYFGLVGLLSSYILLGRTSKLQIICPVGLKKIILSQIDVGNAKFPFDIEFKEIQLDKKELLFEDKLLEIYGFPLNHRIQTHGFEIRKKKKSRHFIKEMLEEYQISVKEIGQIKNGEDLIRNGNVVAPQKYTIDSDPPKSYGFCSDNRILESQVDYIKNIDLLYHEAAFIEKDKMRAKTTFHSTSKEVGQISKLANITNLILGHFSARYDDATVHNSECQKYIENVFCAEDGDLYKILKNKVELIAQ